MAKRKTTSKRSTGRSKKGVGRWMRMPHGVKEWLVAVLVIFNLLLAVATLVAGTAGMARPDRHPAIAVFGMAFPAVAIAESVTVVLWLIVNPVTVTVSCLAPM